MKLTKFFVCAAAIAIVTEVTRRIVTDNNAQSTEWLYDDADDWDEEEWDALYNYQPKKAVKKPLTKAQHRKALLAEQDYWLAQFSDAIERQNDVEMAQAVENMNRITSDMEAL